MTPSDQSAKAAGTLDESFADAGIFSLNLAPADSTNFIFGVQATHASTVEHLYFGGHILAGNTSSPYFLGRLMPDGTLDSSFGTQGLAKGFFSGTQPSRLRSIAVGSDGTILLSGLSSSLRPALARYLPDGRLDSGFGTAGHVVLPLPEGIQAQESQPTQGEGQGESPSVTPLADGKILIIHNYVITHLADTRAFVFLLNSDGSLDTTFNQTGYVQALYPGASPADVKLSSGLIDQDGNLLICGRLVSASAPSTPLFVRYLADGRLDTGFGDSGFVLFSAPTLEDARLNAVIGQPNNRMLALGSTADGQQGVLISLEPDGSANIQFNRGQPLFTKLDNARTLWNRATMQPDGKIVVTGVIQQGEQPTTVVVARMLSDGRFDTTFNDVGWASTPLDSGASPHAITLQTDGKIVVAGYRTAPHRQSFVLRYHGQN